MKKWIIAIAVLASFGVGAMASANGDVTKPNFNALKAHQDREKMGLEKYKKENEKKLKQVVAETKNDRVYTTITFSKYLNDNELHRLIADYGIETEHVMMRAIEKGNGLRGTMMISNFGEMDDKRQQQEMLKQNGANFKGYVELVGYVPVDKVEALAAEKKVYLIDPSGDSSLAWNFGDDYMPGVFWDLEDKGLVQQ